MNNAEEKGKVFLIVRISALKPTYIPISFNSQINTSTCSITYIYIYPTSETFAHMTTLRDPLEEHVMLICYLHLTATSDLAALMEMPKDFLNNPKLEKGQLTHSHSHSPNSVKALFCKGLSNSKSENLFSMTPLIHQNYTLLQATCLTKKA